MGPPNEPSDNANRFSIQPVLNALSGEWLTRMDDETSVGEMLRCVVVLARRYALVHKRLCVSDVLSKISDFGGFVESVSEMWKKSRCVVCWSHCQVSQRAAFGERGEAREEVSERDFQLL